MSVSDSYRRSPEPDRNASLSAVVDESFAVVAGPPMLVANDLWAIPGYLAYDGLVILAEYRSRDSRPPVWR
jgi:hypothetical protein